MLDLRNAAPEPDGPKQAVRQMRTLIAGAGYIGTALGLRLVDAGHEVWALARNTEKLPLSFRRVTADLGQPESLKILPPGFHNVVYCASADARTDEAYVKAYVLGLSNLLHAPSLGEAPQRLLFTSSTAVYGQSDGQWVDENSKAEPSHFSGKRLLEAEALLAASGLPYCIARLAGIYGPGRSRLIDSVRSGTASYAPETCEYTNRIHRDDAARCIQHLLELGSCEPVYVCADHEPAPRHQVIEWLAKQLGRLPPAPVNSSEVGASPRRNSSNKRCSNQRLVSSGYEFLYPSFRDGYAAMMASGNAHPPVGAF